MKWVPAPGTSEDDFQAIEMPRRYRNTAKMVALTRESWEAAEQSGLINLFLAAGADGTLQDIRTGREFVNMSSYSYLGLNRHPAVIRGAIDALREQGVTGLGITPTRMRPGLMGQVQEELSDLFGAQCLVTVSCTVATAALLPLISSGHLIDGEPRVTVFDKRSHFCMDYVKPICADEAPVLVAPHNDVEFLEDVCKRYPRVAYIADGAYSMGGLADLSELLRLQDRYGLFLWFDDSHAISVQGDRGEGYIRSRVDEVNGLTLITGSLEKGFGCSGGVVMLNRQFDASFINMFAGPMCWSQTPSVANLGSILASTRLHASPELARLQAGLARNIEFFDSEIPNQMAGSRFPVRPLTVGDRDKAIGMSRQLLGHGFYVAPVYFPVTSRGRAGLRVMIRADVTRQVMADFTGLLTEVVMPHVIDLRARPLPQPACDVRHADGLVPQDSGVRRGRQPRGP
jgi:7-keto-8-aminopelargonate synthetase-like enzyme